MSKFVVIIARKVDTHEVLVGALVLLFFVDMSIFAKVTRVTGLFVDFVNVVESVIIKSWNYKNSGVFQKVNNLVVTLGIGGEE